MKTPSQTVLVRFARLGAVLAFAIGITVQTTNAQHAEAGAARDVAVIEIPTPRQGSLLQLRGMAGRGVALIRSAGQCHRINVRFVAGDFGGRGIRTAAGESIRIVFTETSTVNALLLGRDFVSDEADISWGNANFTAEVVVVSGLPAGAGFVINPGRNLFADIAGTRATKIPCASVTAAERDLGLQLDG